MQDIKKYEAMAKLDLSEAERQSLSERMDKLIAGFSALESIDTEGTEPLATVLNIQNVLRDDAAKKLFTREELLSNAPEQHEHCFQVPKALEQ